MTYRPDLHDCADHERPVGTCPGCGVTRCWCYVCRAESTEHDGEDCPAED